MQRQQRLVRRHHVFAVVDGRQDEFARQTGSTHEFGHDLHVGVSHNLEWILGQDHVRAGDHLPCLLEVAHGRLADGDVAPCAPADLLLVAAKHFERAATDGPQPEQADLHRSHVNAFLKENEVMTKPSRK